MGKPRSSARSRTIYLNFAFIVAFRDYLYSHYTRAFSGMAPLCLSNSNPSARSRGAVEETTILEVPDRDATRKRESKRESLNL